MADVTDTRRGPSGWNLVLLLFFAALAALMLWAHRTAGGAPTAPPGSGADLSAVLLPFVAIATAIERFWETVFGWYESVVMSASGVFGLSAQSAGWIKTEYGAAEDAVTTLGRALARAKPGDVHYDKAYALFQEAECRLLDAQSRVAEGLKAPGYVALKQAVTLLGSLVIGLGVSVSAHLTLFRAAGFPLSPMGDVVLTGLLIGAGPGPLHQVIGLLQGLRDAAAGLASLAQGSAIKRATEALGQAETAAGRPPAPPPAAGRMHVLPLSFTLAPAPDAPPGSLEHEIRVVTPDAEAAPPQAPETPPVSPLSLHRQAQRLLIGRRF